MSCSAQGWCHCTDCDAWVVVALSCAMHTALQFPMLGWSHPAEEHGATVGGFERSTGRASDWFSAFSHANTATLLLPNTGQRPIRRDTFWQVPASGWWCGGDKTRITPEYYTFNNMSGPVLHTAVGLYQNCQATGSHQLWRIMTQ